MTWSRRSFRGAALVALSGPAMLGAAGVSAQAPTVLDSAGISIITSAVPGWAPGQEWTISERPIVSLGGPFEGEDLWMVRGFVTTPDGLFAVLSSGHKEVRVFDASGQLVRALGREGGGPGEFSFPMSIALAPPDTILVMDRDAIEAFLLDGTILSSHRQLQVPNAFGPGKSARAVGVGPDRSMIAVVDWPYSMPELSEVFRPPEGVGFFPGPGEPPVFVGLFGGALQEFVDIGGREDWVLMSPFPRMTLSGLGPSKELRVFAADNDSYEVQLFDSDGALRRIIRREISPVSVQDDWVDAWIEAQREMSWVVGQLRQLELAWREMTVPETLPAFDAVTFDSEGCLWVTRAVAVPGDPVVFDVFDPRGRYLGEVKGPSGVQSTTRPYVTRDLLMVLSVHALGVERVHVYSLDRKPKGGL